MKANFSIRLTETLERQPELVNSGQIRRVHDGAELARRECSGLLLAPVVKDFYKSR